MFIRKSVNRVSNSNVGFVLRHQMTRFIAETANYDPCYLTIYRDIVCGVVNHGTIGKDV